MNKVSSRNLSAKFEEKFGEKISYSYVNKLLLNKFGRPYRGINTILLKEEHIKQRLEFSEFILEKGIKAKDIIFTDECRVILFPKINPKINIIRFNQEDKKNIHSYEVNKKRSFFRPKFEVGIMIAGGISYHGLSKLIILDGTLNEFSYGQGLLFYKDDINSLNLKHNSNIYLE